MKIPLTFESFSALNFPGLNGTIDHVTSWVDLVWAAITSGKKGPMYWVPHPKNSFAEASSRAFFLYAHLHQSSGFLMKSGLYHFMDPSEKAAASYFMGMTLSKLIAEDFFDAPWLFHVSTASQAIAYKPGGQRPDLIGCTYHGGKWIVVECKGRSNGFAPDALLKAKAQSAMISYVNGTNPICAIGLQAFFGPELSATAIDPPAAEEAQPVEADVGHAMRVYYSVRHALRRSGETVSFGETEYRIREDPESGITIGLPASIVLAEAIPEPPRISKNALRQLDGDGGRTRIFRDGFYVSLDERWSEVQMQRELADRVG
ncbi:hypothetical protein GGR79_003848 [Xanthomonas arboricola]|uniref:hypothetical protein n=1 Tax=Xanthomonas arboricola TaxID=56448 RepID=UPI00142F4AC9|nr:hypothetical protein [Xanthomonas arboricola]NJC32288.1 hypothetical protein [Xanthomonas arboricola]